MAEWHFGTISLTRNTDLYQLEIYVDNPTGITPPPPVSIPLLNDGIVINYDENDDSGFPAFVASSLTVSFTGFQSIMGQDITRCVLKQNGTVKFYGYYSSDDQTTDLVDTVENYVIDLSFSDGIALMSDVSYFDDNTQTFGYVSIEDALKQCFNRVRGSQTINNVYRKTNEYISTFVNSNDTSPGGIVSTEQLDTCILELDQRSFIGKSCEDVLKYISKVFAWTIILNADDVYIIDANDTDSYSVNRSSNILDGAYYSIIERSNLELSYTDFENNGYVNNPNAVNNDPYGDSELSVDFYSSKINPSQWQNSGGNWLSSPNTRSNNPTIQAKDSVSKNSVTVSFEGVVQSRQTDNINVSIYVLFEDQNNDHYLSESNNDDLLNNWTKVNPIAVPPNQNYDNIITLLAQSGSTFNPTKTIVVEQSYDSVEQRGSFSGSHTFENGVSGLQAEIINNGNTFPRKGSYYVAITIDALSALSPVALTKVSLNFDQINWTLGMPENTDSLIFEKTDFSNELKEDYSISLHQKYTDSGAHKGNLKVGLFSAQSYDSWTLANNINPKGELVINDQRWQNYSNRFLEYTYNGSSELNVDWHLYGSPNSGYRKSHEWSLNDKLATNKKTRVNNVNILKVEADTKLDFYLTPLEAIFLYYKCRISSASFNLESMRANITGITI